MKPKIALAQRALLVLAGAILILVAAMILASPAGFYAANGIELGANVSLVNELKAPAGLLLAAGAWMIVAIFRGDTDRALGLAALVYLSYAAARAVSVVLDGVPATGLLQAAVVEGAIGLACLLLLVVPRLPTARAA
jgi:hypothetical protein